VSTSDRGPCGVPFGDRTVDGVNSDMPGERWAVNARRPEALEYRSTFQPRVGSPDFSTLNSWQPGAASLLVSAQPRASTSVSTASTRRIGCADPFASGHSWPRHPWPRRPWPRRSQPQRSGPRMDTIPVERGLLCLAGDRPIRESGGRLSGYLMLEAESEFQSFASVGSFG
jgi:hypothetical protein